MGLTFSLRATLNLEAESRVERWHASSCTKPEMEIRVRESRQSRDSSDNSGDYQRNARFAFDQKVVDVFRIGFPRLRSSLRRETFTRFFFAGRRCCVRAVITSGSALFLGIQLFSVTFDTSPSSPGSLPFTRLRSLKKHM